MSHVTFEIDGKQHAIDMYAVETADEFYALLENAGLENASETWLSAARAVNAGSAFLRFFVGEGKFLLMHFLKCRSIIMDVAHDMDAVDAYMETGLAVYDEGFSWSDFRKSYVGKWDSESAFARHYAKNLLKAPDAVLEYLDASRLADDLFNCGEYYFSMGYVFRAV